MANIEPLGEGLGDPLAGTPYFFLGRRPYREARLRSYLLREHRAGRPLRAILGDPYVQRCGSPRFCDQVVNNAATLARLEEDVVEAFRHARP